MAKLLYIEASPRKSRSKSIEVAHTFLSTFQGAHSSVEVDKLDLWSTELPRFDGDTLEAKLRNYPRPIPFAGTSESMEAGRGSH